MHILKEVHQSTAIQAVVDQLLNLIQAGVLQAGDRLPSENELVTQLKVGRSTVREAIRTLVARNLVEVRAGKGAYVKTFQPEAVMDAYLLELVLGDEAATALHEVRTILETETIALATARGTEADLAAIGASVDQMDKAAAAGLSVYSHGLDFHMAIAKSTHNPVLVKLYRSIIVLLQKHQRSLYEEHADAQAEAAAHRAIYDAVCSRDPNRSRELMRTHLQEVHEFTQGLVNQKGRPPAADRGNA